MHQGKKKNEARRKERIGALERRSRGAPDREARRRIVSTACAAAYGAWLPIVKTAAYLTDFTLDPRFRILGVNLRGGLRS